jgi:hypothetical protein
MPSESSSSAPQTALSMLRDDLQHVDRLFRGYATLVATPSSPADRNGLIARLGAHLRAATTIEDELVYPAIENLVDAVALNAARQDHQVIERQLQSVAERAAANGATLDQRMQQLAETTRAHIAFEEERLFAQAAQADTPALAERVALRRAELLQGQGED